MNAIFFKDNVYVLIENHDPIDRYLIKENPLFIVGSSYKCQNSLYGGRVYVDMYANDTMRLYVDGILIHIYEYSNIETKISTSSGVAFLNQIENLGVDTFLDNYKRMLCEYKKDLEKQSLQLSQDLSIHEDEKQRSLHNSIKTLLHIITGLLFTVSIHLSVGIDNHTYEEIYSNILNQFY